jgi:DNA sulfur modification protein DndD
MLLTKIVLHNFAAFDGTQLLDLTPTGQPEKNIALIGAMNGAGKTSLMEAVRLCLYGERGSGLLPARETPADFIRARFNHNARERRETEMFVELVLDDVELPGATHQIQVRRTWKFHPVRANYEDSDFTISKDGKPLQIVDSDHWQDFINDNIPPGVAGFFFFDGEKIQQLAEDANDRAVLRDSIRNLLGLSVYTRLGDDLTRHTEDIRRDADKVTNAQLKQLEADEAELIQKIEENREHHQTLSAQLKKLQDVDDELEREVRRIVGTGADSRDQLQKDVAQAEAQKRAANDEILRVAGELLPFAVAGKICDELRAQIEGEEKRRQWEASKSRVHPQLDRIVYRVFHDPQSPRPKPDITPPQRNFYAHRFTEEWETLFTPKPADAADELLHELSAKDERAILGTLDQVSKQVIGTLRELLRQRERASKRLQDASRELRNLPEDDSHVSTLFNRRRTTDAERQTINRDLGRLDDEHARHERDLNSVRERIANFKQKLEAADYDRERVALARRVQEALGRYEKSLQERKLAELEERTTEMYARLARKSDFVGHVKIDPHTFDVAVHDPRGRVREKRSLSAGEKQIYAISLLWGLARTSNVELPIIIDTPFARLDSAHRTRIAEHYFPHASEQVIILSTDEEIDHRYIELLKPYVGRTYLIEHIDAERRSEIKEGYFHA